MVYSSGLWLTGSVDDSTGIETAVFESVKSLNLSGFEVHAAILKVAANRIIKRFTLFILLLLNNYPAFYFGAGILLKNLSLKFTRNNSFVERVIPVYSHLKNSVFSISSVRYP